MSSPPQESPRLKVALVGCGQHARRSILPCLDDLPADLVATCDVDPTRAREYASRYGTRASFTNLAELIDSHLADAVLLVVGPRLHPELACQAMSGGLHVWMEKPPGMNVADVDRMLAARAAAGRQVVVGCKKIFMPAMDRLSAFLSDAKFGAVRTLSARYPMDVSPDGPAVLAERRPSNWLSNGVHPLSAIVGLGGRPRSLTVHRSPRGGGFVTFEFPTGVLGCLHMAAGHANSGSMERYEVVCEHGHLVLENCTRLLVHRPGYPFDYGQGRDFAAGGEDVAALVYEPQFSLSTLENKAIYLQGFHAELQHFVRSCLSGEPATRGTLEFARAVMECYEAGLLSQGKPIVLDDLPANQGRGVPSP
ncbi:MAG: Gfo/Idh/MocA family oxidoreductase [Phycisphaeraceae bacterium]|nr:Gfo/Idh/MocA family oxidoreductase [Phycisphaeraceae bacterium]